MGNNKSKKIPLINAIPHIDAAFNNGNGLSLNNQSIGDA